MKKTHVTFLRRIIGDAIDDSNRATLTEKLLRIKTPSSGIYRMMRDIVCDVRFYSVTENDAFWKNYGSYRIGNFIDSLSEEEWEADETLTILKEDFLNDWMLSHMMPMSEERRKEIEAEIRLNMSSDDTAGMPDPEDHDGSSLGILHLGIGIKDATNRTGEPADGLPTIFKDYMDDANGGTSPGLYNDGHRADARFLGNIDPSITTLAEIIGRRGKSMEPVRGKFRPAPKSDINGVTLSNDLNSLLPSELALLASPYSEKIFLNRYVRKRLQTFSSVSSSRNHKEKHGPIYICIDTSGSMTGEPEELAKILVLAIAISAQKEKRTVCILNYSDSISFFVLRDLKTQRRSLLLFLSESYGGGNDENKLFRFLFGKMPKMADYKDFAKEMMRADMLVISDFLWSRIDPESEQLIDSARKKGMRVFSIGIDGGSGTGLFDDDVALTEHVRKAPGYRSGQHFYLKSDFRYLFLDGRLKEDFR